MCTALVVRDGYWERQRRILAELFGVSDEEMKRVEVVVAEIARICREAVKVAIDRFNELMVIVVDTVNETISRLVESLKELFDEIKLSENDDYFTVCDKLESYAIYTELKCSIQKEQYYKNCFKLAKMNYAVRNYDRRCVRRWA